MLCDILEINWANLSCNKMINIYSYLSITFKSKDKIRVRRTIKRRFLKFHVMVKWYFTWFPVVVKDTISTLPS